MVCRAQQLLFNLCVAVPILTWSAYVSGIHGSLNRDDFPSDFVFGVSSSAYQYEGAANVDGRGTSIWDTFTSDYPGKIADHSTGKVADEFYYMNEEDITLAKEMGWDSFRFSISWPRIAPHGKISRGVNQKGVDFYNNLINQLLRKGLKPFVTLFHFDLPQALEDEYSGFLSYRIVDDFRDYVEFCFQEFGDRVKHWITVNEPNYYSCYGYASGVYAPGRCSDYMGNCSDGDSATEPYIVGHNLLLSHAAAVKLYKEKHQATQNGIIGITISSDWMTPKYPTNITSIKATARALDFQFGWFAHPITYGKYPRSMRRLVGKRLPEFTLVQSDLLKGSFDYIGINYYTARYVDESTHFNPVNLSYTTDCHCNKSAKNADGVLIGLLTQIEWLYIYPEGIRYLLHYVKKKYNDPVIYITENGMGDLNNFSMPIEDALRDDLRIYFHQQHLSNLSQAIKEGVNVKGYFVWSLLDNFEWAEGYTARFGVTYVDYLDGLRRYPKDSASWFRTFLQKGNSTEDHKLRAVSFLINQINCLQNRLTCLTQ